MRLAHYRVVTEDVRRLADFYHAVTQAPVVGTDDYMEVQIQPASIAINSRRVMDRRGGRAAVPGANRSTIIDLQVADVDANLINVFAMASRDG